MECFKRTVTFRFGIGVGLFLALFLTMRTWFSEPGEGVTVCTVAFLGCA